MAEHRQTANANILLIIGGGIAAYKALEVGRHLQKQGANISTVLTEAAQKFITPLSAGALLHKGVYTDLFQRDVQHIALARQADLIIVVPATAHRMAKMVAGFADDLAGAILLSASCPILCVPAMNPSMWAHAATQHNYQILQKRGIHFVPPIYGEMAEEGEAGLGRMAELDSIITKAQQCLSGFMKEKTARSSALKGKHFIVTSGPTKEKLDPIRFITNYSSGKQGHAIAQALATLGAQVTLISGCVNLPDPSGVLTVHVESGQEMLHAVEKSLPADGAIFVAAVTDWCPESVNDQKIKKEGQKELVLNLRQTPDILSTIGHSVKRPPLVIGFAAETENLEQNAQKKLLQKNADIIVANNVRRDKEGYSILGGDDTQWLVIERENCQHWGKMNKKEAAEKLAQLIAARLPSSTAPQP